jgi:UDP-N-acetylglucosamine--N-acetylmuramyl-(pentapeptide) pyrophosphoryl-undecaprenol N-acetylglucosamine transferase
MSGDNTRVLIMAAGTGGHVFPALSIARCLQQLGAEVHWLATHGGMENELLKDTEFNLHRISVSGLRGSGLKRKLTAPFMLFKAYRQSMAVIRRLQPACVLGMGGFVCGPAGLAAKMRSVPLLIHEQNAVAGLTNRLLSRLSQINFEAFPNTFPASPKNQFTGNPLRQEIIALHQEKRLDTERYRPLNILVLGGSQGATAINKVIPEVLANWGGNLPAILHQSGRRNLDETRQLYQSLAVEMGDKCRVEPFIDDMAAAYQWADLVICRSGASTVSELAAAGLPAILVPYPHHKDRQQYFNAAWMVDAGAACLLDQQEFSARTVLPLLRDFDLHRDKLGRMQQAAHDLAVVDAAEKIARQCLEVARG